MLVRIVKMIFRPECLSQFKDVFEKNKSGILGSPGCQSVVLYQDKANPAVFFTYSHWDTETDLENYRQSVFFKNVWGKTKAMFAGPPEAWSLEQLY